MRETQALILAPTRELAGQIQKVAPHDQSSVSVKLRAAFRLALFLRCVQVLLALGDYMNVQCHACIGGTNVGEDIRKLDYGQHVVAGTPGRVFGEVSRTHTAIKHSHLLLILWLIKCGCVPTEAANRRLTAVCVQT